MNYKLIGYYLGKILQIISLFLLLPVIVGIVYRETTHIWPFLVTIGICFLIGFALTVPNKPETKKLRSKEGLIIVGMSWIIISLLGALPYVFDGCIPNYLNALFETVSGLTTTGATILSDEGLAAMPKCMLFWRSLTHWIGGMGILVFILAVMPGTDGSTFHLFRFESPGPQVGKLASKVRHTATILYLIYFIFTIAEMLFLLIGGIGFFDSICIAMSTAGTGGFANTGASIAEYDSLYIEMVVMIFMFIFSINFNLYYLIILRHFKIAFLDEELHFYCGYVVLAISGIVINLVSAGYYTFGEALRYSSFSVLALTSSTGFATADFATWPQLSQNILLLCMLFGACAGSTGGGMKASRILIVIKAGYTHFLSVLSPRSVQVVRLNGKMLNEEDVNGVVKYFLVYVMIFIFAMFLISVEGRGLTVTFSSVLSCLNNDGPYLAGAFEGYGGFSPLSKIVFMLLMLIGRLEIFPLLLLFIPKTWNKNY
jgi:trk system potassium uptake protein TrkH